MLTISADGHIRLTLAELGTVTLAHLISGLDEGDCVMLGESAAPTDITGYTEWISIETPPISLGWDWVMVGVDNAVRLKRLGTPRSNCMLQDEQHQDLGYSATLKALEKFVDTLAWQAAAASHIDSRYKN
jgi:hypothetical protein